MIKINKITNVGVGAIELAKYELNNAKQALLDCEKEELTFIEKVEHFLSICDIKEYTSNMISMLDITKQKHAETERLLNECENMLLEIEDDIANIKNKTSLSEINGIKCMKYIINNEKPKFPAVYIMRDIKGNILYIGETNNLYYRLFISKHKMLNYAHEIYSIDYIRIDNETIRCTVESMLIL